MKTKVKVNLKIVKKNNNKGLDLVQVFLDFLKTIKTQKKMKNKK